MGLGSAARCLFDNPYDLLVTVHETLLEWLKEAVTKKEDGAAPVQAPAQAPAAKPPTQNAGPVRQNAPQARVQAQNVPVNQGMNQNQGQRPFPQGRPGGVQQMPNQSGPSRIMTAQPQQVRQPPNVGRGRGQMFNSRGGALQGQQRTMNGASGTQNDAIPLD